MFPENQVTQNNALYPLHNVPYAPAKFEVASRNCFGGDLVQRVVVETNVFFLTAKNNSFI